MSPLLRTIGPLVLGSCLLAAATASAAAAPSPAKAAASRAAGAPDRAVLGLWKIEQARGAPLLHKLNARLELRPDGKLVANGGCNVITATYTLHGNALALGPLDIGHKQCSEALMEQEDRVISALERTASAKVPPHRLVELLDSEGRVLLRASRPGDKF